MVLKLPKVIKKYLKKWRFESDMLELLPKYSENSGKKLKWTFEYWTRNVTIRKYNIWTGEKEKGNTQFLRVTASSTTGDYCSKKNYNLRKTVSRIKKGLLPRSMYHEDNIKDRWRHRTNRWNRLRTLGEKGEKETCLKET